MVTQKPLLSRLPAAEVTWLACTIGAVVCLPFAPTLLDELRSADAATIWWVINLPPHVNVNALELMPTSQSFAGFTVSREG